MGFFNKIFGYKWSLYILKNDDELHYALHNDSVIKIIGYIMESFKKYGNPKSPWSLRLNCNKNDKSIVLKKNSFNKKIELPSRKLLEQIENIDPNYRVTGGEIQCINVIDGKKVMEFSSSDSYTNKLLSGDAGIADLEKHINESLDRQNIEKTFKDVLNEVFDS